MNLKIITKNHASDQEVGFLDFKAVWLHCRQRRGWNRVPLSSAPPQISTSVPHKRATPFHLPKFLSSTLKTPHFNTPPDKNCVEQRGFWCGTEGLLVWNWEGGGTEGFLVLNWGILGAEEVWSLCGTDVMNWGGLCGTEGYSDLNERKTPLNAS